MLESPEPEQQQLGQSEGMLPPPIPYIEELSGEGPLDTTPCWNTQRRQGGVPHILLGQVLSSELAPPHLSKDTHQTMRSFLLMNRVTDGTAQQL